MGTNGLTIQFEIIALIVLCAVLIADLLYVTKRPHIPSMKEAGIFVGIYISLALIFGAVIWTQAGPQLGQEFYAGWVTEYALSVDNLFVFIIIMARFSVPRKYQQEVLMFGIIIALVLRAIFIVLGAAIIEQWSWVFYIFGAFLLWTAWNQLKDEDEDEESGLVKKLTSKLPISKDFDGAKLRTVVDGKKLFTPMVLVFVTIGMTDLLFAFDSIPAIFGLTKSAFIVFTANIFALMGLRQLYFLLGGLMNRLVFLKHALSFILAFIGVKLVFHALHENSLPFINGGEPLHYAWLDISVGVSLLVILGAIVIATVLSLWSPWGKRAAASAEAAELAGAAEAAEQDAAK
ncbi:tellurite resistance protein TerC [Arthrobacter sp. JUb119]|uniref:TerC family protein n=1 Tax=Micrococcaceae TaxID=1268 RepID=UPI000CFDDD5F|nr:MULTISPECIES: TerC family protein [unclassified Arthrobacter]MCS3491552.1 tellurite resistance protein TerC [Arthrobacter sp. JUb119]PQZ89166.1 tellurium resistance protein TerC [Arthrobacter sp. MYb222]PRB78477.1 tellurium resistance protein TerC [Arthrobacter sp. MYb214]TDU25349.1 tellurite resistance protein TerC [Arthrobacter sp. JUb115]